MKERKLRKGSRINTGTNVQHIYMMKMKNGKGIEGKFDWRPRSSDWDKGLGMIARLEVMMVMEGMGH